MRILYLAAHGVLEYDELRLLAPFATSLFSTGMYVDPRAPTATIRPALELPNYDDEALELWRARGLTGSTFATDADFLARFDVIVAVHTMSPFAALDHVPPLPTALRTIGQNDMPAEVWLSHLQAKSEGRLFLVRYSPGERRLEGYAGEDALIRFGKSEADFGPPAPQRSGVVSFGNSLVRRAAFCMYDFYLDATAPFERRLYGDGNPAEPWSEPGVSHERQLRILSEAGVFFSLHTLPASYTLNFMEGMLAGVPVVTVGQGVIRDNLAVEERVRLPDVYEAPDILAGAPIQLTADSVGEAHEVLGQLLGDPELARRTGAWCRARAEMLFGFDAISRQWSDFLGRIA